MATDRLALGRKAAITLGMKILVTGGCGFIGSHTVDRLVGDGHAVRVLDNLSSGRRDQLHAGAALEVGDVGDAALVARLVGDVDAVIHLAAVASVQQCEADPVAAHRTNFLGTQHVLDAAAGRNIPVVYASSAAVYGDNPNLPLGEDAPTAPLGQYGRDKLAGEQYAHAIWESKGVPSVGLRFFNVYGPRQDPRSPYSGVISIFAARAMAGEALAFHGDGEQTRDFVYVGDIVELLVTALKHTGAAERFNGCTGRATSLRQLAAALGQVTGRTIPTAHQAARGNDIRHSLGNPLKAQTILNFTARTELADGLKALVAHA